MSRKKTGTDRLTVGLLSDLTKLLQRHGYALPADKHEANSAMGKTIGNLALMVADFEGLERCSEIPNIDTLVELGCRGARLAKEARR